jgi:hypothetical protein
MSSRQLLSNIKYQKETGDQPSFVHVDATYKLMQSGFLLLTMSTEDRSHHGRLVAIAISLHENSIAYQTFFTSVKSYCIDQLNLSWEPQYVLSDGAESIQNAVKAVFPNAIHLLCYFHLIKAVRRHIQSFKPVTARVVLQEKEQLIIYGINLLHKTQNAEEFTLLWSFIKDNWKNKLRITQDFINYFEREYIQSPMKWTIRSSFIGKQLKP